MSAHPKHPCPRPAREPVTHKQTNPEACEPIHLDQQLALDPYQTCSRCFQLIRLAAPRGPGSGSGLTDQSGKTDSFLGILSCLSQSPVRLDQQLAIDPCCPSKTHRRMSSISRPASSRLASRRASQCDLTAQRRIASGARPNRLATIGRLKSCALQALPPSLAPGLVPPALPCRKEMRELAPSHRGTAVPCSSNCRCRIR